MKLNQVKYRKTIYIVLAVLIWLGFVAVLSYYEDCKEIKGNSFSVHEVIWRHENDSNESVYRVCWYLAERKTRLRRMIEKFRKTDPDDNCILIKVYTITYPADNDANQVIKNAGLFL